MILIGIICLGFIVFFHELGHFLSARACGVEVESFSIGMGPVLLHKTIGRTDYRISLLPFGGYCGMKGEKDFQKAIEEDLPFIGGSKDSLYGVNPFKRALIGFAGPFFNILFAVIAYSIISGIGYTYSTYSNVIDLPSEETPSPARDAGLLSGDRIIKINSIAVNDFADIFTEVALRPDEDILVTVERGENILTFNVHTLINKKQGNGIIGITKSGNLILKHSPRYTFFGALGQGIKTSGKTIHQTVKSLGILFKGVDLTNAVSGPARITSIVGETAHDGFSQSTKKGFLVTLELMALISISLFIMNMLPIPILDGGLVLFALLQGIFGIQLKPKTQYRIQIIGVILIGMLFAIGLTGDIKFIIEKITHK